MSELFRKSDPSRLVHYEGIMHDRSYPGTSDIESQMYTPAADVEAYLKKDRSKPFILCEYSHAMGNSCGAIFKYTDLMEKEPLFQGGFIWDFIDQAILAKDPLGRFYMGYGGDFDDRPHDREFSGDGLLFADRKPSPKLQEVKFVYAGLKVKVSDKKVAIANRNLFIPTSAYDCKVFLEREGKLVSEGAIETNALPGEEMVYEQPLAIPEIPGEYVLTVSFRLKERNLWADAGHEVAWGQCIAAVGEKAAKTPKPLQIIKGIHNFGFKGEGFEAIVSNVRPCLVSYKWGGRELMKVPPAPSFWRAPTDNDRGCGQPARHGQWKLASLYSYSDSPAVLSALDPSSAEVSMDYKLPTNPASSMKATFRFEGDSEVRVTLFIDPSPELPQLPEFGMLFTLPLELSNLEWYGNGPEETYSDRRKGAKLGVYKGLVKDQLAPYLKPQETGNKTGVRWAKLTDGLGHGILFSGDSMEFSALHYTPNELENALHPHELPAPFRVIARVNLMQMGIAGDNTWGAQTHEEFLLPKGPLTFTFSFKGI
jgi:beta-galactosidase